MRASKENAAKATAYLHDVEKFVSERGSANLVEAVRFAKSFIDVAFKKLPHESSFIKDEQKRTA